MYTHLHWSFPTKNDIGSFRIKFQISRKYYAHYLLLQIDNFFIVVCKKNLRIGRSFKQLRQNLVSVSKGSHNSLSLESLVIHSQPQNPYILTKFK